MARNASPSQGAINGVGSGKERGHSPLPPSPSRPLFNIDIDVGRGVSEVVTIYSDDDPYLVVTEFLAAHGLPLQHMHRLMAVVERGMGAHGGGGGGRREG